MISDLGGKAKGCRVSKLKMAFGIQDIKLDVIGDLTHPVVLASDLRSPVPGVLLEREPCNRSYYAKLRYLTVSRHLC
jgi:hypothetical protein